MRTSLRPLLERDRCTIVPGAGDPLSALLAEQAGFEAVYMSGYYVCATMGMLDVGLVSSTEMFTQAARISEVVKVPLLVDADTGYGNALNAIRTVAAYEAAGAAGMHLEDQSLPKKCGHLDGIKMAPTAEMCRKIEACVDHRRNKDFLVIARTDAIGTEGMDSAIQRGKAYSEAGADAIMIMAPRSLDDMKRFRDGVSGPLVCTVGSWPFEVDEKQLTQIGYSMALFTVSTLRRSIVAMQETLSRLRRDGGLSHEPPDMVSMNAMHQLLGQQSIQEKEGRYAD